MDGQPQFIIRSSAAPESLLDRGKYLSRKTTVAGLSRDLAFLLDENVEVGTGTDLGFIVQVYAKPLVQGHLSNERHVAKEYRDAAVEVEPGGLGVEEPLGYRLVHRNWRRSTEAVNETLTCASRASISDTLREPLAFAVRHRLRIHYEWLWDGQRVVIVQADRDSGEITGEDPTSKVGSFVPPPAPADLECFRIEDMEGAESVGKLRSHMMYRSLGFWQPTFYVVDDQAVIASLAAGSLPTSLANDLIALTLGEARLIIRTSYAHEQLTLLPRSPLLACIQQARDWLMGEFSEYIRDNSLGYDGVTLLAHHYVPALAAAYSMASPQQSNVLIEALWGVPEGLDYYPCDQYRVSTPIRLPEEIDDHRGFSVQSDIRFKSHFVAPDSTLGRFRRHAVRPPNDWSPTIPDKATLYRIAHFARSMAEKEGHTINMMWFIGCETPTGMEEAIPWYQETRDASGDWPSFRRSEKDEWITVSTEHEVEELEGRERPHDGRLVINLFPTEDGALRDAAFARRVGAAARALNAIVILHGSRLSHIYYVLLDAGATVVAKAPLVDRDARAKFWKLVRDKIPETVTEGGESVIIANLSPAEYLLALKVKLIEEAFEVRDAAGDHIVEELADVQEVLHALTGAIGVTADDVEEARVAKAVAKGEFTGRVQLVATTTPTSRMDAGGAIEKGRTRDLEPIRRGGADQRVTAEFVEIVKDLSVSLTRQFWDYTLGPWEYIDVGPVHFREIDTQQAAVAIAARRHGTELRFRIKLRIGSAQRELSLDQLELPFESEGDRDDG